MAPPQKLEPQWQPIGFLPVYVTMIGGMLEASEEQCDNLTAAKARPYSLDDYTLERIIKLHTEQQEFYPLWRQQFELWEKLDLSLLQEQTIGRLREQINRLEKLNTTILDLAEALKTSTIDYMFSMDTGELLEELMAKETPESLAQMLDETVERIQTLENQYLQNMEKLDTIFARHTLVIPESVARDCLKRLGVKSHHLNDVPLRVALHDYCLYDTSEGRQSVIATFMDQYSTQLSDAELILLNMYQRAQFKVLRIETFLMGDMAVAVYDMVEEEHKILMEEGLEEIAYPGDLILCYCIQDKEFMFTGHGGMVIEEESSLYDPLLQTVEHLKHQQSPLASSEIATHVLKQVLDAF